ncbi:MAG: hypothetical protein B1H03_03720 [Planctomycetales bacterium 4484_113]|nr:MAG: hypothetical protein B1H03_03720 [Planctomycetales bacterium 4484_113]
MSQRRIDVTIIGREEDGGQVTLAYFLNLLTDFKDIVKKIDALVSKREGGTSVFRIVDLKRGSPSQVAVEAHPKEGMPDHGVEIRNKYFEGWADLSTGKAPADYDQELISKHKRLARAVPKKVSRLEFSSGDKNVEVSEALLAQIEKVLAQEVIEQGHVEGRVELLNVHGEPSFFAIYPLVGPDRIRCKFKSELFDKIKEAMAKYAIVYGKLHFRKEQPFAHEVDAEEIEIPDLEKLPSMKSLRGIAPDLTRGIESSEFVRRIRESLYEED